MNNIRFKFLAYAMEFSTGFVKLTSHKNAKLEFLEEEIKEVDAEIKKYCKELGIKAPILR